MKKFRYIIPVILVAASSCTSQLFTGTAYDDLYYRESDQPVVAVQQNSPDRATEQYYDNIFAGDTLIADEYVPYDESVAQEVFLKDGSEGNNYYNYLSPSDQIYLFNDSYFYPYWRDPFYFSPFSTRLSFGYNYFGSPYFGGGMYDPFWYDSYMYTPYYSYSPYWGYNSWGYNSWGYNSYWGNGYNPWMYSGYYNNGYYYQSNDANNNYIARRGGFSTSTRPSVGDDRNKAGSSYNRGSVPSGSQGTVPSRRSTYGTTDGTNTTTRSGSGVSRTSTDGTRTYSAPNTVTQNPGYTRREATGISTQVRSQGQVPVQGETRTQSVNRPQYQTTERTYTPSYNNPRMSSRPSYNNSRSTTEGGTTVYNQGPVRSSGGTSGQTRTQYNNSSSGYTPSRSSSSPVYSAPSRSSGSTSVSSGSRSSSGGSSYSGGSSGSYSSGSRSSSSGSYSSGSSSGSSSSSSSTSSSSSEGSGGRRR